MWGERLGRIKDNSLSVSPSHGTLNPVATATDQVPAEVLGRVLLITGGEEFLAERAVQAARASVRQVDAEAAFSELDGGDVTASAILDLAAPSLFSNTSAVVIRRLEDASEEAVASLLEYAADPSPEVAVSLVHSGGQRGSGVLTKLRKLPAVTEVATGTVKGDRDFAMFVINEFRRNKVRVDGDVAEHLVRAVGQDLRSLASAADQLSSDFEGQPISLEMAKQYFEGRAEAKSFSIADAALAGRTAHALEELRWALETGTPPVLVTSAVAGGLRGLARLMGAGRGMRDADLAREIGVPPWKLSSIRSQARGWDATSVGQAIQAVARADADIKGQASDPGFALERMVISVSTQRRTA